MKEYKSRKFLFSIIVVAVSTTLLIFRHIGPDVFATIMGTAIVGYMGGNVGEHFANRGTMNG